MSGSCAQTRGPLLDWELELFTWAADRIRDKRLTYYRAMKVLGRASVRSPESIRSHLKKLVAKH